MNQSRRLLTYEWDTGRGKAKVLGLLQVLPHLRQHLIPIELGESLQPIGAHEG